MQCFRDAWSDTHSAQLPVILNKDNTARAGVPPAFYAVLLAIMCAAACLALLLKRPERLRRSDGSVVAVDKPRIIRQELAANFAAFKDWRFVIMLPAFLPAGSFLIYNGSVNGEYDPFIHSFIHPNVNGN